MIVLDPPCSPLVPYTTLFRSIAGSAIRCRRGRDRVRAGPSGWNARGSAAPGAAARSDPARSEEHTSELQSRRDLVCRLLLEKKKHIKQLIWQDNFAIRFA